MNGGVCAWTGGAWKREEARRMDFVMEVNNVNRNSQPWANYARRPDPAV